MFVIQLDIQEFYESILLDEQNDRNAKVNATHHLADEWERQPMLRQDVRVRKAFKIFYF